MCFYSWNNPNIIVDTAYKTKYISSYLCSHNCAPCSSGLSIRSRFYLKVDHREPSPNFQRVTGNFTQYYTIVIPFRFFFKDEALMPLKVSMFEVIFAYPTLSRTPSLSIVWFLISPRFSVPCAVSATDRFHRLLLSQQQYAVVAAVRS